MPIVTLDPRLRQLGRIRTGVQVPRDDGSGLTRPKTLASFRLTSSDQELIGTAASIYGGIPTRWRDEWEVVTESAELDVVLPVVPPAISQWFELWTAGGCTRRCDGEREQLTGSACLCPKDPAERMTAAAAKPPTACRPTTRLSVILPGLPDVGVWMLESRGYYVATELAAVAEILQGFASSARFVPARLGLDERSRKVPGGGVKRYTVPVIRFAGTLAAGLVPVAGAPIAGLLTAGYPSRVAGAADLTREQLIEACNAEGFPLAWAVQRAQELYGRTDLTPSERGALLELLRREAVA